ncbi:hypothetical protein ZIOFF_059722 [Zingiber officinale]|uniref:Uncharacterized protein n=1 Tax=Zingiber officinale TaxID=94328 RepID=A0A8J5F9T1_ZINOF|nr:hypothetical protein ZIOFF_059722 [Zingiber officinale]
MLQEEITKEFEERKIELEAKALEIYQASDVDIKYAVMPQHISCSVALYRCMNITVVIEMLLSYFLIFTALHDSAIIYG